MSSVSGADRNRHTEELRNQREEYQERESEEVKKHRKEIRRLNQQHGEEVARLKENYNSRIEDLRSRSNENMTERDQANQAKIEEIRSMYHDQLKRKVGDSEDRKNEQVGALRGELAKSKQINEQQKDILVDQFNTTMAEREDVYKENAEKARVEMQDALKNRTSSLNAKHEKELSAVTGDRDRMLAQSATDKNANKNMYENKLRSQERQFNNKMAKAEENWHENFRQKEVEMDDALQGRNQALQLERRNMQDKYDRATQAKTDQMDQVRKNYEEAAQNRGNRELRSANFEAQRQQNMRFQEAAKSSRMSKLEKGNIIADYEKRIAVMDDERAQIRGKAMDEARDMVQTNARKNERLIGDITREDQRNRMIANERHAEDRARLEIEAKQKEDHTAKQTDGRIRKVIQATNEAQTQQIETHEKNLNELKSSYAENLMNQRQAQFSQLKDTYLRMEDRLRQNDEKHVKKLEDTEGAYQAKIKDIEKHYEGEIKKRDDLLAKKESQGEKVRRTERETMNLQFESKLAKLDEEHQRELDRLEKRHNDQMLSLTERLNYYRKKA